jgi:hypothetical protein
MKTKWDSPKNCCPVCDWPLRAVGRERDEGTDRVDLVTFQCELHGYFAVKEVIESRRLMSAAPFYVTSLNC